MDLNDMTFTLKGSDGVEHQYLVMAHLASQGFAVIDAMLAIGIGPLAEAAFAAAKASEQEVVTSGPSARQEISLKQILDAVDMESAITSFQAGLRSVGGISKLAPLVFAHTTRDGVALIDPKTKSTAQLDLAYTRNYREMLLAFQKVVEINGFFDVLVGFLSDAG